MKGVFKNENEKIIIYAACNGGYRIVIYGNNNHGEPKTILKGKITMHEEIFRKKSLDRVKSPENLDDYIRVSNPGVWLLLISVIVLLVGVCVWGIFGHVDSVVPVSVHVENGNAVCCVAEENIKGITEGMPVKFEDKEALIETIGAKENGEYICKLKSDESFKDGFYNGKVVTKSYKPLSFVLN